MIVGNKVLADDKPHIWGILNVTPDSFSDGGNFNNLDAALKHAEEMIKSGADIIDVGGMSTRPGHEEISETEEIERLCPVVAAISSRFDTIISADTYRASVADAAGREGAGIINDIGGLLFDTDIAGVIGRQKLSCCIMHNGDGIYKNDFMSECIERLEEGLRLAFEAGVSKNKIILDPGIGFAKTHEQNLLMMKNLERLSDMGYPVLLGTSRKRMVGNVLELPVNEREEGTIATTLWGLSKGIMHFRVHDVEKNMRAIKMWMAIQNTK